MSLENASEIWESGNVPFTDESRPLTLQVKQVYSGKRSSATPAILLRSRGGAFFAFLLMDGNFNPIRRRAELQVLIVDWYDDYAGTWGVWKFTNSEWEQLIQSPRLYAASGSAYLFKEVDLRLESSAERALLRIRENPVLVSRSSTGHQVGIVSFRPYTPNQMTSGSAVRTYYLPIELYKHESVPALFTNIRSVETPAGAANARTLFQMIARENAANSMDDERTITAPRSQTFGEDPDRTETATRSWEDPDRTETVRNSRGFAVPQGAGRLSLEEDPDRTETAARDWEDLDRTETARNSRIFMAPQGAGRRSIEQDPDRTLTVSWDRTETVPRNWGARRIPFDDDPERTTTVPRPANWLEERLPPPSKVGRSTRLLVDDDPDSAIEPSFSVPAPRASNVVNPFARILGERRSAPVAVNPQNPLDGYEWLVENRNGLFAASVNGGIKLLPRMGYEYYSQLMSESDEYERVGPAYVRRDLLPRVRTNPDGTIMIGETKLIPRAWTEDEKGIVPGRKHMRTAAKMWNKN